MAADNIKKESVRKSLVEIGLESNVHGISRIVSDRPLYLRLVWLGAFLAAFSFGCYQVSTIITLYLEYPVKTNVKIAFKPLEFPAITFCNMNIIKRSESGVLQSTNLKSILNGTFNASAYYMPMTTSITMPLTATTSSSASSTTDTTTSANSATTNSLLSSNESSGWMYTTTPMYSDQASDFYGDTPSFNQQGSNKLDDNYLVYSTFVDEFQRLDRDTKTVIGHQIENMLLECQFAGRSCDPAVKKVVTFDYGNCYTLQSRRYISGSSGPLGGMTMTFSLENHEAFQQMTEGYGLRLVIHEIGSFPLPFEQGMTISGGYETSIGIKLTKITRQGGEYGTCQDPLEYFRKHYVRYSIQGCIQTCWENIAMAYCGCVAGYMRSEVTYFQNELNEIPDNNFTTEETCYRPGAKDCSTHLRRDFLSNVNSYCDCPPPCFESAYTKTFSGRLWPHETKLEELKNKSCATYNKTCGIRTLTGTALSSNFLKIHIYFEDLNYELITEEPLYDVTQVISDIGGSLGLCIGVSLMCICEAIEAIIQIVVALKRNIFVRMRVRQLKE